MKLSASEIQALLPLFFPALAACLLPIAALDRDQKSTKWIRGALFAVALFAVGLSFHYFTGLWAQGFQPSIGHLRMDRLAQFTGIFVMVAAALAILQLWDHLHHEGWVRGESLSLLLFSCVGMVVFASTSHLLLLFLGLELLSIPLYALTATVRTRPQAVEGGLKYFLTGAVAASCFLMGAVLLYGFTGSLDVGVIGAALNRNPEPLALLGAALLLLGFLFKISAVPFHQWTPDAYEAAPHPIAGFMSVATKGAALIALLRVFPGALSMGEPLGAKVRMAVAILAAATLVLGNLSALSQTNVKRMLAYSSISHAGYLLLGLVAGTPNAQAGMLFYLAVYLAMNMGAFGLLTVFGLVGDRTHYDDLRGLGWKRPGVALAASLCMFSLAGIPPTAGFYGKYMIFKELIGTGHVGLALLGVLASLVSVYYYLRVMVVLFMEAPRPGQAREAGEAPAVHAPFAGATLLVCGFLVILAGLIHPRLMNDFALRALDAFR
ncbi:MAG: NADH-quinone oxidoreductase subunit N [Acidobacteria bacterium]|nr:NADH-quinone oxidoreductase subunit N [Acidobacteriota bacterium]